MALAAHYFLNAKSRGRPARRSRRPLPSRQRRAARPHQLAWPTPRPRALREAYGLMVNYRYELKEIEQQPRGLRQRGRRRRLARRARPPETKVEGTRPSSPRRRHSRRCRRRAGEGGDLRHVGGLRRHRRPALVTRRHSPGTMYFAPTPTDVARMMLGSVGNVGDGHALR